jgi:hypothetical protein
VTAKTLGKHAFDFAITYNAIVNGVIDEDEKTNGNVVALCLSKDITNTCLQSSQLEYRNIYFPKGDNSDIYLWVDSAVQAVGDVKILGWWMVNVARQ